MYSYELNMRALYIGLMVIVVSLLATSRPVQADAYNRNQAVPVKQVLFGEVLSVRQITERELIEERDNGWATLGGALIGGVIGNQFGGGSGQDVATVLGAIIGAQAGNNSAKNKQREVVIRLVEIMIRVESGQEYMVVQDFDPNMQFKSQDNVRMIYLANDTVRVDKQY